MPNIPLNALNWLPIGFDWTIVPLGLILAGLATRRETRRIAAVGFLVAAGLSAALLSLLLAMSAFYLIGYGRALVAILLNFGPSVTRGYLSTLLHQNGVRVLAFAPMVATALSSTLAAVYLRKSGEA